MKIQRDHLIGILFFIFSLFVFTRGLGTHGLEYRDDEIFYFQSTKEMMQNNNILSPTYFGEDRFQKPVLFYWMILLAYKIFGVNWFAARFIACFFASLTVSLTWLMAKELFDRKIAALSSVVLITVPLFFRHAKNAVPDMTLNFFIVLAIYSAIKFLQDPLRQRYSFLFFVSCALGFMVKGFAAIIVPMGTLVVYLWLIRRLDVLVKMRWGYGLTLMAAVILPWFIYMIATHGPAYLQYMLVDETKNRLLGDTETHFLLKEIKTMGEHFLFYAKVILSYFAPWSVFLCAALPLALFKPSTMMAQRRALQLLLVWFFVVFFFFASMYFVINHYMLVLTTPFVILISHFFLEKFNSQSKMDNIILFARKYLIFFIFSVGCFAFAFLFVFLAGANPWWLVILLFFYGGVAGVLKRSRDPLVAPLTLAIFIVFVFAQSSLLGRAGITAHATLQNFASTIHEEGKASAPFVIGVGSHDIHEKEFQVYFDQKVEKAATSENQETRMKLAQLFNRDQNVYCLITEKDFKDYLEHSLPDGEAGQPGPLEIIQEDYIFRKRTKIDKEFFIALWKLDQKAVYHYLMEKVVLVKKGQDA